MALTTEMKEAQKLLGELNELKALRRDLQSLEFPLDKLSKLEDETYKELEALKGKL